MLVVSPALLTAGCGIGWGCAAAWFKRYFAGSNLTPAGAAPGVGGATVGTAPAGIIKVDMANIAGLSLNELLGENVCKQIKVQRKRSKDVFFSAVERRCRNTCKNKFCLWVKNYVKNGKKWDGPPFLMG